MRQYRTTLVALGLIVVLFVSFVLLRPILFQEKEEVPEDETVYNNLFPFQSKDIVKIESQAQERYVLEKNDAGRWLCTSNPDIAVYDSAMTTILNRIVGLSAGVLVEGQEAEESLERFGFDEETDFLRCTMADGTQQTLYYGTKSHDGSRTYVRVDGVSKIYSLSRYDVNNLQLTRMSLINANIFHFDDTDKIQYFSIYKKGQAVLNAQASFSAEDKTWQVSHPLSIAGDDEEIEDVIKALVSLSLSELVAADCQDLSQYGLEVPRASYVLEDNKVKRTLSVGGMSANQEYYYCTVDDSKDVYTVLASTFSFLDTDPITYIYRYLFLENVEGLSQVSLQIGGQTYLMDLHFTEDTATYLFNGINMVEGDRDFSSQYKKLLTAMLSLKLQNLEEEPAQKGKLLAEFLYTRLDGTTATVSCYQRDEDNTSMHLYVDGEYSGGYASTRNLYGTAAEYGVQGCLDVLLALLNG